MRNADKKWQDDAGGAMKSMLERRDKELAEKEMYQISEIDFRKDSRCFVFVLTF